MPGQPYFHIDTEGLYVLFQAFPITTTTGFAIASVFVAVLCWAERAITYYLDSIPYGSQQSAFPRGSQRQTGKMMLRTGLYGLATCLRLMYMLVTMTYHAGLFILVVLALTTGQLVIEYLKARKASAVPASSVHGTGYESMGGGDDDTIYEPDNAGRKA